MARPVLRELELPLATTVTKRQSRSRVSVSVSVSRGYVSVSVSWVQVSLTSLAQHNKYYTLLKLHKLSHILNSPLRKYCATKNWHN